MKAALIFHVFALFRTSGCELPDLQTISEDFWQLGTTWTISGGKLPNIQQGSKFTRSFTSLVLETGI
jgi:hypothetical protein